MAELARSKGIKPWIQEMKLSPKNLVKAMEELEKSNVRYRFCMTNYEEQFPSQS